jgi:hypothetical protein
MLYFLFDLGCIQLDHCSLEKGQYIVEFCGQREQIMTHKRYKTVKNTRWKYFKRHCIIGSLEHEEIFNASKEGKLYLLWRKVIFYELLRSLLVSSPYVI